ncbi:hypothetical protein BX666DRAFT_2032268 [Dichotomocladium elegans]|nr:hypothetical protein BX666DRAFT_2032268 [Dichotomocladium elegans]
MERPSSENHSSPELSTQTSSESGWKATRSKGAALPVANPQNKRNKSTRACDECRKRKPCAKCRKSEIECVFAKLPPKRCPPKQYIELLEGRLQLIEKALRAIDGLPREILDEAQVLRSTSDALANESPSSSTVNDDVRETTMAKKEGESDARIGSSASSCSPKTGRIADGLERFSINEIGQAMYVNDFRGRIDRTSNMRSKECNGNTGDDTRLYPTLYRPSSNSSTKLRDSSGTSNDAVAMETDSVVSEPSLFWSATSNLPPDIPLYLIRTYFTQIHKYVPMIHSPYFLRQINDANGVSGNSSSCTPSPLLLYAMCAVASRWVSDHSPSAPSGPTIAPGFSYYQRAFAKIDEYSDAPRLSTIQALVLLTKYQEYYRRLGFFHRPGIYLGMAVKMCNDLGLSKLDPGPRGNSYAVFLCARAGLSIEQGREPFFSNIDCTTGYPVATNEEGPQLEEVVMTTSLMIQLCRILSDIAALVRRVEARQRAQGNHRSHVQIVEEYGRLFLLHTHLENFIHELPSSMSYLPTHSNAYPAEKQSIHSAPLGFLHMIYHFSMILLHRHYVLHPLPESSSDVELEPYLHEQLCAASASNITTIVDTMLETYPMDAFSYPTRGVQSAIHCVTMAATVHRRRMTSHENGIPEIAKQQYQKSISVIHCLAAESPAVEFYSYIKEAELAQLYDLMAVNPDKSNPSLSSHLHNTAASLSPSSTVDGKPSNQHVASNNVSLSDTSSTSSSPLILAKEGGGNNDTHPHPMFTGRGGVTCPAAIVPPASCAIGQYDRALQQQQQQQQAPYYMEFSQGSLLNSSAAISDPDRFASLMMHNGISRSVYNHHQQSLSYAQQPQPLVNPHASIQYHPRRSRLGHPSSYSQEDLRSLRRAHMNKPISAGNFPPAHARSSSIVPDLVYPNTAGATMSGTMYGELCSPMEGYKAGNSKYAPHQTARTMPRRLRRQQSMIAMMPSCHAQRQQQSVHQPPPLPRPPQAAAAAAAPPPPTHRISPLPPTMHQRHPPHAHLLSETVQPHHRRHIGSASSKRAVASVSDMTQPQKHPPFVDYQDSDNNDSMMYVDTDYSLPPAVGYSEQYPDMTAAAAAAAEPAASSTADTLTLLNAPSHADPVTMNQIFMGSEQWARMTGLEDLQQRSEGHVI